MNLTFGIITYRSENGNVDKSIDSIEAQGMSDYEIIVVGDYTGFRKNKNVKVIPFDESVKAGWITRKKNIITENATNEVIVYCHDYIRFCEGFYQGWESFGYDWDLAMNIITNTNDERFRDWVVWDEPQFGAGRTIRESWCPEGRRFEGRPYLPSYDYDKTNYMYISGAYWLAKKWVMEEEPLNESLSQCQGEDVEWSKRVLSKYKYAMNTNSEVQLMRYRDRGFNVI